MSIVIQTINMLKLKKIALFLSFLPSLYPSVPPSNSSFIYTPIYVLNILFNTILSFIY